MDVKIGGKQQLKIEMFGGFTIQAGNRILTDAKGRTRQIWNLLEFLVANRLGDVSQEKLIEILWADESCADPLNALKNLVYRLRGMLKALDGDGEKRDYILYKRNTYCWNNALNCTVDTEELEKSFRAARDSETPEKDRLSFFSRVVGLYQGEFLPKSSTEDWVVALSAYYRNIYIEAVKGTYELLVAAGRFEEADLICRKAVALEPLDESLQELVISLHLKQGDLQGALDYYDYVSEMFYEKLDVEFSERIRAMMREVEKELNSVEKDMAVITTNLLNTEAQEGAFFCDYDIFRNIYRLEARMVERFGESVFVALLTVEPQAKSGPQAVSDAMQALRQVITKNLRKCDVASLYSKSQFIMMLPALTFENGKMVLGRLISKFNNTKESRSVSLSTRLNPLSPLK